MSPSPWFPFPRIRTAAATVVYCLPCAGASATIYRNWREAAPAALEIVPVELPGRGRRFRETPIPEMSALLEVLTPEVARDAGARSIALFGHSMGAIVAFEAARALGPRVRRLFVSGSSAPHLRIVKGRSSLADEDLKRELAELGGTPREILEDGEMMALLMPMLRADFALIENYRGPGNAPLPCPLTVFAGTRDAYVDMEAARAWERYGSRGYRFVPVEGHHFYLDDARDRILDEMAAELSGPGSLGGPEASRP